MFCKKCGNEIPDDSLFCLKCGTKVEKIDNKEDLKMEENFSQKDIINKQSKLKVMNKKTIYSTIGIIALILIVINATFKSNKECSLKACSNSKMEGSSYCSDHTCKKEGCTRFKSKSDKYCSTHKLALKCKVEGCTSDRAEITEGRDYCSEHTCKMINCYNKKIEGTDYCTEHQIDMSKKLTDSGFRFSLDSAGGIVFSFSATNSTMKQIKYIRFKVKLKNAVGDLIQDVIKRTTSVDVEIVGPVKPGDRVWYDKKIIGYNETCARIDIDDITIVYADGTSETGHYGYYAAK